jgi:2Fe-2S ferredoxin
MKIIVTDREGALHTVDGIPGQSLMEVLRDLNFVVGSCDGHALCGTCHVFADPATLAKLPPPGKDELDQLHQAGSFREGSSRLSCQIRCTEDLSGMHVVLAPYE